MKSAARSIVWKAWLAVICLPLFWLILAEVNWERIKGAAFFGGVRNLLEEAETLSIDYRYRYRGALDSPVKVVYVGKDIATFEHFGNEILPREAYARAFETILSLGNAEAVFLDVILNRSLPQGGMIDPQKWLQDMYYLSEVLDTPYKMGVMANRIILAARVPLSEEEWSFLPMEVPAFPLWAPFSVNLQSSRPRIGLINIVFHGRNDVPRYVPTMAGVSQERAFLSFVKSLSEWNHLQTPEMTFTYGKEGEKVWVADESRRLLELTIPNGEEHFFPAALEVLRALHADMFPSLRHEGDRLIMEGFDDLGNTVVLYDIPLHNDTIEINWFAPWINRPEDGNDDATHDLHNPKLNMLDLLIMRAQWQQLTEDGRQEEAEAVAAELRRIFEGALVLIGPFDPIFQDVSPTPFERGNVPRVSAHGNLLKTILSGAYINRVGSYWRWSLVIGLSWLVWACAVVPTKQLALSRMLAAGSLIIYALVAFTLFRLNHIVLPLIVPLLSAISTGLTGLICQVIEHERQRSRITSMFGSYLAPELVRDMVNSGESPRLGGHNCEISAFFSDVQGFSTFAEVLSPAQLVELMNEYLDAMTEILEQQQGTLDKYIGDAMVGIFGAPVAYSDHARRACVAAAEMQVRQLQLQEKWRLDAKKWPGLVHRMRTRIGIHSGVATVGNMGSRKRFNYTMMGDTVNLAARNESAAKTYGVYTMVSQDTRDMAVRDGFEGVFRYLDKIVVKGRSEPVSVYELTGIKGSLTTDVVSCLELYEQGVDCYLRRDWAKAADFFRRSSPYEQYPVNPTCGIHCNPSSVMLARSLQLQGNPPGVDWDGRFVMQTK